MSDDERDNPGIKVPPPLIYLIPLVLGLILDRRAHVPFLPSRVRRIIGWPLIGGGALCSWAGSAGRCATLTRRYAPTGPCRD